MKKDELKLLLDFSTELPVKRLLYILNKWLKRGWHKDNTFTEEFHRIKDLIVNKEKYINQWDGRVVIVNFMHTFCGDSNILAGIIEDNGDNGWYFHTVNNITYHIGYDYHDFPDIAYVELHPSPRKLWTKLNFNYWKRYNHADRFHAKISTVSPGTICDYSRMSEGIFTYSNPAGKIGDCFPWCQCKFL